MADAFLIRKGGGENLQPELTEQETLIQQILESLVGKVYGANATPETILKGYSAYVHQELVEGTAEPGVNIKIGTGKMNEGEFTLTSDSTIANYSINHELGTKPLMLIVYDSTLEPLTTKTNQWNLLAAVITYFGIFGGGGAGGNDGLANSVTVKKITADSEKITLGYITEAQTNRTGLYLAGRTYKWIALA